MKPLAIVTLKSLDPSQAKPACRFEHLDSTQLTTALGGGQHGFDQGRAQTAAL